MNSNFPFMTVITSAVLWIWIRVAAKFFFFMPIQVIETRICICISVSMMGRIICGAEPRAGSVSINLHGYLYDPLACTYIHTYWVTQKLPQIYTANHATFPVEMRKITVQIGGNFWVTKYIEL